MLENLQIAASTMRIRVEDGSLARSVLPGQFFMLRLPDRNDPLIGRAFAVYDCSPDRAGSDAAWLDFVYLVKGRMTSALMHVLPGAEIELVGPLGNSFSVQPVDHLILVAGGVGFTPMWLVAQEALGLKSFGTPARPSGYARRVSLCYGVRTVASMIETTAFREKGIECYLTTDDGSFGPPCYVTDRLREILTATDPGTSTRIVCCGPEPMMEAVSMMAQQHQVPCEVSLETPMACGLGICFTCVAKIGSADQWDYRRTCVEGPIFDGASVVWC